MSMQKILEKFDSYKIKEYGKWKIGRAEAKQFLTQAITEALNETVIEERYNLITEKRRLTYSDIDNAWNSACKKQEDLIKKLRK